MSRKGICINFPLGSIINDVPPYNAPIPVNSRRMMQKILNILMQTNFLIGLWT